MKRREFIKGSAILGLTAAGSVALVRNSGMYHEESKRKVLQILSADRVNVGTLPVLRAFAGNHLDYVSPFVLFDEFGPVHLAAGSDPLRVDAHPHAGVTPTTYFLEGTGHHKDSLNYDFQVGKGEFMMFSSGSGAIHMEETGKKLYESGGKYHGFQIWLNLPSEHKMIEPAYYDLDASSLNSFETEGFTLKLIAGSLYMNGEHYVAEYQSVERTRPAIADLHAAPHGVTNLNAEVGSKLLIYVYEGAAEEIPEGSIGIYDAGVAHLSAKADGFKALVLAGMPLKEPVVQHGPFVMNTSGEIKKAIQDFSTGQLVQA